MNALTLDGVTAEKKFIGAWPAGNNANCYYLTVSDYNYLETSYGVCDKLTYDWQNYLNVVPYCFGIHNGTSTTLTISLPTSITTLADANTWLANNTPTIIYISTSAPTMESADPYTSPQIVDDFGTETLTDYLYETNARDVEIPVGHVTRYPINMRKKLEDLPDGNTIMDLFGNTLRQLLAISKGIDFNKTVWIDLGTLSWQAITYAGVTMMACYSFTSKAHVAGTVTIVCSKYEASNDIWSSSTIRDRLIATNYAGYALMVYDSTYTDAAAFKAAMKGVLIAYEKA